MAATNLHYSNFDPAPTKSRQWDRKKVERFVQVCQSGGGTVGGPERPKNTLTRMAEMATTSSRSPAEIASICWFLGKIDPEGTLLVENTMLLAANGIVRGPFLGDMGVEVDIERILEADAAATNQPTAGTPRAVAARVIELYGIWRMQFNGKTHVAGHAFEPFFAPGDFGAAAAAAPCTVGDGSDSDGEASYSPTSPVY